MAGTFNILSWAAADGSFKRQVSSFRSFISKSSERFSPAAGRYHLYLSFACPWVSRPASATAVVHSPLP